MASTIAIPRRAVFSSLSVHWATPRHIFDELNREFRFTLDPCPLGSLIDGLKLRWANERIFCNPPYGPGMAEWIKRDPEADIAVFLVPARTDTIWFHDVVLPHATEIRFLRGRLRFNESKGRATFPSMIVVFEKVLNG
jgi:DNA N-6-adenine-methyltransferase (Dam)